MTDVELVEDLTPLAHVTMTFLGPVAPHWEMKTHYGDEKLTADFWTRVTARLMLLPKHDPQFRRNRERVNRDAERERIICSWDLGEDDAETVITEPQMPPEMAAAQESASEVEVEAEASVEPEETEANTEPESAPEVEASAEPEETSAEETQESEETQG